jgi:hypothetical protein
MNEQILTALAFGIVSPTTLAATGDLDPGVSDVGRLVLLLLGVACLRRAGLRRGFLLPDPLAVRLQQ